MIRSVRLAAVLAGVLLHTGASAIEVPLVELEVASGEVYARDMAAAVSDTPPDVNCAVGAWRADCDCDTKTLTQVFKRRITVIPQGNGQLCPPLTEVRPCFPVHCEMTPWTEWDDCNDNLDKIRTRDVKTKPKYGGRECPHSIDKVKCCKDDCIPGAWGNWTCDDSNGKKTRTRPRKQEATSTGVDCKKLKEVRDCDPEDCELFKEEDDPGQYGQCIEDKLKRKWYQSKQLMVKKQEKYGGKPCPVQIVSKECPPVNCELYSAKEDPGPFSLCEVGYWYNKHKTKKLGIKIKPVYGGKSCPPQSVIVKNCTILEYLDMFDRDCDNDVLIGSLKKQDRSLGTPIQVVWGHKPFATYFQGLKLVKAMMLPYDATKNAKKLVFEGGTCGGSGKSTLTLNLICGEMLKLYAGSVSGCATTATMEIPVEEVCDK